MFKILTLIITTIIFVGCGSDENSKSSTSIINTNTNYEFYNLAELGTIINGNVTISSKNEEYIFYTTTTNNEGLYPVNPVKLLENIDNLVNQRPEYVLVTVQNGRDIDVNDDGIRDEDGGRELLGKIKAIYKLDTITTQGSLVINLLSTPIAEILQKEESLDDDKINEIIKKFGIKDINEDGEIDNKDIYQYRMVENSSNIEEKLREELLAYLHENNDLKIKEVTDQLKKEFNIISYNYNIVGKLAYISLTPSNNKAKIQYGINSKNGEILNNIYSNRIELNKNDYLIYKECSGINCSSINILSFDGSEVKNYFIQSIKSNIYDVDEMNRLRASINEKTKELEEKQTILGEKQEKLVIIQSEIREIQNEINENNSKLTGDYL